LVGVAMNALEALGVRGDVSDDRSDGGSEVAPAQSAHSMILRLRLTEHISTIAVNAIGVIIRAMK
jgi:hypothetical protein